VHPLVEMDLMRAIYRDRVRTADEHRRLAQAKRRRARPRVDDVVVIRQATARDTRRLERLATLDGGPTPAGPVLVAEMCGKLVAALPLEGKRAVADPDVPSAPLVDLLRVRAAQLRPAT
jgi:hypothetical protein